MTIIEYCIAVADARKRAEERDGAEAPPKRRQSVAVSLEGQLSDYSATWKRPAEEAKEK